MKRRRWNWKRIGILAAIAFGIYVAVEIALAGRGIPPIPPGQQAMELSGGHVTNNRISTKSWSFDYNHAQLSPDGTFGTVEGVRNGVVYRHGKPFLKISAQQVTLNTSTLDFTATGRVHVERIKGESDLSFDTDLIVWSNATKLLHIDHPSYVRTNGHLLKIETITVDLNKDEFHFGKIDGTVGVP